MFKSGSILDAASHNFITASTELLNSVFSFSLRSISSIFSTPSLPMITGTPAYTLLIPYVYAGVPVIIGNEGVEKIEEIDLNENEKTEFNNSVEAVIKLWDAASKIDPDLNKD